MSRETSRGRASVRLLCEAFGISRQAYYAALLRPARAEARRRPERACDNGCTLRGNAAATNPRSSAPFPGTARAARSDAF
jgi:hypothetical protein